MKCIAQFPFCWLLLNGLGRRSSEKLIQKLGFDLLLFGIVYRANLDIKYRSDGSVI